MKQHTCNAPQIPDDSTGGHVRQNPNPRATRVTERLIAEAVIGVLRDNEIPHRFVRLVGFLHDNPSSKTNDLAHYCNLESPVDDIAELNDVILPAASLLIQVLAPSKNLMRYLIHPTDGLRWKLIRFPARRVA